MITALTLIAEEHRATNAATIVAVLESHIAEGNAYQRLPAMYVLDSIVKNIGEPYTSLFGMNLPEVRRRRAPRPPASRPRLRRA